MGSAPGRAETETHVGSSRLGRPFPTSPLNNVLTHGSSVPRKERHHPLPAHSSFILSLSLSLYHTRNTPSPSNRNRRISTHIFRNKKRIHVLTSALLWPNSPEVLTVPERVPAPLPLVAAPPSYRAVARHNLLLPALLSRVWGPAATPGLGINTPVLPVRKPMLQKRRGLSPGGPALAARGWDSHRISPRGTTPRIRTGSLSSLIISVIKSPRDSCTGITCLAVTWFDSPR